MKCQHRGSLCSLFFFLFFFSFVVFGYQWRHRQVSTKEELEFFFAFFFLFVAFGCKWAPSLSFSKGGALAPTFFSFPLMLLFCFPHCHFFLFSNVGKKVCFTLICGFCNFGRCKPEKKQGLLEKSGKPHLNWQMAWEVKEVKEGWKMQKHVQVSVENGAWFNVMLMMSKCK